MQGTQQQRKSDCTMLFVDRGFPIDVIFYASVWERREREEQSERASRLEVSTRRVSAAAVRHQIQSGQKGSGAPQVPDAQDPRRRPSVSQNLVQGETWQREAAAADNGPDSTFSPAHSQEGKDVSLVFVWLWEKFKHTAAAGCANPQSWGGDGEERPGNWGNAVQQMLCMASLATRPGCLPGTWKWRGACW